MRIRSTVIAILAAALAAITIGGQAQAQLPGTTSQAAVTQSVAAQQAKATTSSSRPTFGHRLARTKWDVRLTITEPRGAGGVGVSSLRVQWGDGTSTTRTLDPSLRYTSFSLPHHYTPGHQTRFITMTLTDVNGAQAVKGPLALLPLYKVNFTLELGPIGDDCDTTIFTGKGDFEVWYSYEFNNGRFTVQNEGKKQFDLSVNETYKVFGYPGIAFRDVTTLNYPKVYWDWKEKDTFDIWFPDFDTGVGVAGVSPQGLTRTSNWVTWDKPGCTVRFRTTTTVYFEQ